MDRRNPSPKQPLTSEEEEQLRCRFPRTSFWILGTELTEEERLASTLRGTSGGRGKKRGRAGSSNVADPRLSRTEIRTEADAVSPQPLDMCEARPTPDRIELPSGATSLSEDSHTLPEMSAPQGLESHPRGYFGPCWDCLEESSFLIARGDDNRASSILGSCRHLTPSLPISGHHRPPHPHAFSPAILYDSGISPVADPSFFMYFVSR